MSSDDGKGPIRLVMVDLAANNCKWWEGAVVGTALHVRFGRVGEAGQASVKELGSEQKAIRYLSTKVREKQRHQYTFAKTEGNVDPTASSSRAAGRPNNAALAAAARREVAGEEADPETLKLVEFLAARNVHAIEGATGIRMENRVLQTPLGRVTADGVEEAYALLGDLAAELESGGPRFAGLVDSYLRLVPRAIGRRRIEPQVIFPDAGSVSRELETLDAVRQAVDDLSDAVPAAVFRTRLTLCTDGGYRFTKARRLYESTANARHTDVRGLRLVRLWEVSCGPADDAWEAEGKAIGNVERLFHGTSDANVLSLLKSGYVMPRTLGTARITGAMFGSGLYYSNQSTKSVRYSTGAWAGGRSARTFLLLNDVATGRRYHPRSSFSGLPPAGFDSTWVDPGCAGVLNHEAIIYRASQARPVTLLELA